MSRKKHITALAAIVVGLIAGVSSADARPPNIVLILADDLGYGDVGCFGQQQLQTPRLDGMAKEGMKLTQFYAGCTVCAPSRCVLMTGKHMGHTVVRGNSTNPIVIQPGQPTVASVLKGAGYATGCVGKWGIGTPGNFTNPNDVGFDHFFGYVDMWHAHNFYPEFLIRNGEVFPLKNEVAEEWKASQDPTQVKGGRGVAVKRVEYAPDLIAEDALRFIRENKEKPFFLYLAMNVPHANNEAKDKGMEVPDLGEFASKEWPEPEKGFASMIRNIDRDTGRVLDLLKELKIDKDTLVIFTSDNGPHREGGHSPDFFDSNGQYRGIKRDLYEGGIRVPTIAWWPGTIKAGSENAHQWYFGDLMATAAELAGAEPPSDIDSDSFVATLRGNPPEKEWARKSTLYWEFYEGGSSQAVRFGKWKAIRKPMFTGEIELYDLSWDHDEDHNYAERRPKLVELAANLLNKNHTPDPNWKVPPPRPKAEVVLCLGDSITHKGKWVAAVGKNPKINTINSGLSGRKAAQVVEALEAAMEKHRNAKRVMLFLGVNDLPARDKRPGEEKVASCIEHMSAAIDLALTRFKPKDIILVAPCNVNPATMNEINRLKGYDITPPLLAKLEEGYRKLAAEKKVQFLSLLDVVSPGNFQDGLHPNEAGDAEISAAVATFLTRKH